MAWTELKITPTQQMAQLVESKFTSYFSRDYITMIMYLASSVHPGAGFYVVFESAELEYILCSVKGSPAFGQCAR